MPRAPARLGRIQSTDIAPQLVLQRCCQSVHSAGPKTRRYQLTVLSDQRKRRQVVNSQFATHAELFDLSGKRGLVTGGTRGIGMMIARGFLQAGLSSSSTESASAQRSSRRIATLLDQPADLFSICTARSTSRLHLGLLRISALSVARRKNACARSSSLASCDVTRISKRCPSLQLHSRS